MKTIGWVGGMVLAAVLAAQGATNDLATALQKGLFEEEANGNLGAAIQAYQSVANRFDQDRRLAATAIYRLGECFRKQGNTNDAAAQFQRVVREFSDQSALATLSRQSLAGLGLPGRAGSNSADTGTTEAKVLADRLAVEEAGLESQLAMLTRLTPAQLPAAIQQNYPDPLLTSLLQKRLEAQQQLVMFRQTVGTNNATSKATEAQVADLNQQILEQVKSVLIGLQTKLEFLKVQRQAAAKAASAVQSQESKATPATSGGAAGAASLTSNEADEVKHIQALIKDSPDLINASEPQAGTTPLHRAARQGQLVVAQFLLANGADTEAKDTQWGGRTPLHYAAAAGHKAMVELLLSKGANVQATDKDGTTPLHLAAEQGYRGVVEFLVAHQALVNAKDKADSTPLLLAATHGFRSIMEFLLAQGADINAATRYINRASGDSLRGTALTLAVQRGDQAIAAFLLGKGAAVDVVNSEGRTPLSYATDARQVSLVKSLLEAHADPNAGVVDLPLAIAAWSGDLDTLKLLLAHGADPNTNSTVKLAIGRQFASPSMHPTCTPLFLAVNQHHPEVVKALIQAKADPNGVGFDGNPVLFEALGDIPTLQALLEGGANPNQVVFGENALQRALNLGDKRAAAVDLLLAHGADPNVTVKDGITPLHSTVWLSDPAVAQLLIKHGAQVNARLGDTGQTPLHLAVEKGNAEMVKLLLENGADPNARSNSGATPLELAKSHSSGLGMPPGAGVIRIPSLPGYPTPPQALNYTWTAPGTRPPAQPSSESQTNIAELLRQHGALDDLPRMDAIEVRRPSSHYSSTLSNHGGTDANQITLAEAIGVQYGLLAGYPEGGSPSYESLCSDSFKQSLPFPDLAYVHLRTPAPDLKNWQEKRVDLTPMLGRGDCSCDAALSWGEVVELPEQDHSLDARWMGFTGAQMENLVKCLGRQVEIVIKGQTNHLTLGPKVESGSLGLHFIPESGSPYGVRVTNATQTLYPVDIRNPGVVVKGTLWLKAALLNSGLVLASSDLSRVKVTRLDPATGKKREWVFDCTAGKPSPVFWLREGDVIEVPERSDVYSSATPDSPLPAEAQPLRVPVPASDFSQRLNALTFTSNAPAMPPGEFQQKLQNIIRTPRIPATNPPNAPPAPTDNPPADQ